MSHDYADARYIMLPQSVMMRKLPEMFPGQQIPFTGLPITLGRPESHPQEAAKEAVSASGRPCF